MGKFVSSNPYSVESSDWVDPVLVIESIAGIQLHVDTQEWVTISLSMSKVNIFRKYTFNYENRSSYTLGLLPYYRLDPLDNSPTTFPLTVIKMCRESHPNITKLRLDKCQGRQAHTVIESRKTVGSAKAKVFVKPEGHVRVNTFPHFPSWC